MDLSSVLQNSVLQSLLTFGVLVALTVLVGRLARLLALQAMRQSRPQVAASVAVLASVVVYLIGGVIAIQELGISPDILLVVVGLLGAAALIGLREQLENFGGKYFSDVYSPFKVGDSIKIRTFAGKVIEINAMTTVLLSDDDQLIAIPNSMFMKEVVVNTTPQAWKEVSLPITVGASVDVAAFESAIYRSLAKLRSRLDRRFPPVITTRSRTPVSTDLTVTVMIRRPEDREVIINEVQKRITEARGKTPAVERKNGTKVVPPGSQNSPQTG
ncbi:MAG: mechanosensitive ion channel family protein [Thermoplasmata archaeon]|nr:mechanosensitive ion channel family protein [Thermoplasmata archaeon]